MLGRRWARRSCRDAIHGALSSPSIQVIGTGMSRTDLVETCSCMTPNG
jgi:hypothetical protein